MMIDVTKVDFTKIYDAAAKMVQRYRDLLMEEKVDASGQLSRTADFDLDFTETHITVYFILESYWWYIEHGRNRSTGKFGNWVSKYSDIERWVRQKIARGSFVPSSGHTIPRTDREIKRVAGAIVHKITHLGFYGTTHEGKHLLQLVLDEAESEGVVDEIIDYIVDAYDKMVTAEFMSI